jgi:hypothetical protein
MEESMSNRLSLLGLLLATAMAVPAAADAQELAGKWIASYPTRIQNVNGAESADQLGTALLTFEVKGDSVFGTWHAQNTPRPSKPRAFRGTFKNGMLNFTAEPVEVSIRRSMGGGDGSDSPMRMITYYEGALKDGAIVGTFRGETEDGAVQMQPVKWAAKRDAQK